MAASIFSKKGLFLLSFSFLFVLNAYAQNISNYAFSSATTPAYSAISGTAVTLVGDRDEGFQNDLPIGFDFWYMGVKYNTFSVSTNGWMAFGQTITDATPTNNLRSSPVRNVIAPLWDDLEISSENGLSYLTEGAVGTRTLTVQWTNVEWAKTTNNRLSFQVKLSEATGAVTFIYINNNTGSGNPETGRSGSIGISAAVNQAVSVTVGSSSARSDRENSNVTNQPSNNTNYRFLPPIPAAPTALSFTNIGSESIRINWTAVTANRGYLIYRSRDATTGFVQVGEVYGTNANNYTNIGLDPSVKYYYRVVAIREILSAPAEGNATTNICADNPSGLIANYKFDGNGYDAVGPVPGTNPGEFRGNSGSFTDDKFGNGAYNPNGTNDFMATTNAYNNPQALTISIWFKTTTTVGGVLIAFASLRTDAGEQYSHDRMLYMTPNGKIYFGVYSGSPAAVRTVATPGSYNDGKWHQVTGVLSSGGMELYMDAVRVGFDPTITSAQPFSGYWRVGHSKMNNTWTGWGSGREQAYFKGALDDVVIYHSALAQADVRKLYRPLFVTTNTAGSTCAGEPFNLNISDAPGASFAWTGPNGYTSPFQNPPAIILSNATVGEYTVTITTAGGCPIIRSTTATFNDSNAGLWTGKFSTAWDNPDNWCAGKLPTATSDVTIPTTGPTNNPTLTTVGNANNLNIQSVRSLTISGAGDLQITGTITNSGTITASDGGFTLNGTAAQIIPANQFAGNVIKNLTINNPAGLTLNGALRLTGILGTNAGIFETNDNLTLASTATNTASVATIPSNASVRGQVRVERFVSGGNMTLRNYRMFSSPVYDNTTDFRITGERSAKFYQLIDDMIISNPAAAAGGFDITHNNQPSAWTYATGFSVIPNINTAVNAGRGMYVFFRGNRDNVIGKTNAPFALPENTTIDFKGILNQQDVTVPLISGFSFVGNPYAATIDWNSTNLEKNNLADAIWIWNPATRGYATYGSGIGLNGGSEYISSGQSFFVKTINTAPGSITFKETSKTADQQPPILLMTVNDATIKAEDFNTTAIQQTYSVPRSFIKIAMNPVNSYGADELAVVFNAGSSSAVDAEDVMHLDGEVVNVSTMVGTSKLAINFLPIAMQNVTVPIHVNANKTGNYQFTFNLNDYQQAAGLTLNDAYLNQGVAITENLIYNFEIDKTKAASFGADRFSLGVTPPAVLPVNALQFAAQKQENAVALHWEIPANSASKSFEVYRAGADGIYAILTVVSFNGSVKYHFRDHQPALGQNYYKLVQVDADGKLTATDPIMVNFGMLVASSISPNPATTQFTIAVNDLPNGEYFVKLTDVLGRQKKKQKVVVNNSSLAYAMNVSDLPKGIFFVQLYDVSSGKVFLTEKLLKE